MRRINITCPACGSKAYLRPASVVYGDKAPDPDAKYYVCGRYNRLWNCRKASCVTFSRTRCSPMLMCAALWIPEVWMRTLTRVCSYGFLRQAVMGIGSFSAAVTK